MPITRITSFADVVAYMQETNLPHRADAEGQVIDVPTNAPPFQGHLIVRWEKHLPYVQVIALMIKSVPAARRAEVEHAICRANNTIPLPGFGYQYKDDIIYMRLCVPVYDDGIAAASFRKQVMSVVSNARQFVVPFQKVVDGTPGEQILVLAASHAAESAS